MEWERHISELISGGPEAFEKMYRKEYSKFLVLCTIISPKILVNDEMSRCRTGKDTIKV